MAVTVVGIRSRFLSLANPDNTDSYWALHKNSHPYQFSITKSNPKNAYPQLLHFIFRLDSLLSISRYSAQYETRYNYSYLPATGLYFPTFCGRVPLPVDARISVTFFNAGSGSAGGERQIGLFPLRCPRRRPSFPVTFRRNQLCPNTAENDIERLNDGCVFQIRLIGS